jgi:hypothetical protein
MSEKNFVIMRYVEEFNPDLVASYSTNKEVVENLIPDEDFDKICLGLGKALLERDVYKLDYTHVPAFEGYPTFLRVAVYYFGETD